MGGRIYLLSVLALAFSLWRAGLTSYAVTAIIALLVMASAALFSHSLPGGLFLQPVDVFHLSLMLSYAAICRAVLRYGDTRSPL